MESLSGFLESYLASAREDLHEMNHRFIERVPVSARPHFEEVLGAFAASLDILEIARQDLVGRDEGPEAPQDPAEKPEIISVLGRDAVIQFESASITPELGYSEGELVGHRATELVHPDDVPGVQRALDSCISRPGGTAGLRLRFRHADGSWRWIRSALRSIRGEGEISGFVVHSHLIDVHGTAADE